MYNFEISFTNNDAERALRPIKSQQNVSGGFRSQRGAYRFTIFRSYTGACREQGVNVFNALLYAAIEQPVSCIASTTH